MCKKKVRSTTVSEDQFSYLPHSISRLIDPFFCNI